MGADTDEPHPPVLTEFWHYFTLPELIDGGLLALKIAVLSVLLAWPAGLLIALVSNSRWLLPRLVVAAYIWVFRGTPLLLQLIFLYNVLPQWGLQLSSDNTAVVGLALNGAAFAAEIFRGGLNAVNVSQIDAARSIGLSPALTLWRIQLPQALRVITPALASEAIMTVKNTSLASAIAVAELTLRSQQLVAINFEYLPVFGAAAAIYLCLNTILMVLQQFSEWRLDNTRSTRPGPISAWVRTRMRASTPSARNAEEAPVQLDLHAPEFQEYWDRVRTVAGRDMTLQPTVITIRGLRKSYGENVVLDGVDLDVQRGEVVCILGPSGSGKSTLLRAMDGLVDVDAGSVVVNQVTVAGPDGRRFSAKDRLRAGLAIVFQQFNLFQHMTVSANLREGQSRVLGLSRRHTTDVNAMLLRELGVEAMAERYPAQLSGGQQQRVAIARALALAPEVMLFDEPTSALDPERVGDVLRIMRQLADQGMTMVVVTHEIAFARQCASRVLFVDDGRIIEEGPPSTVLDAPSQERTRAFLSALLPDTNPVNHGEVLR
ncbi:amino acid ABC transporter permease/ATP-binding protein [Mycobacterium sp. SMC-4]|uniref:amino acid ABC transporter permease/ATP-binding protein n=1 Tax=Mycobacterium sp. SMC-4 TaxID=2857059 RepID=UPI003D001030